MHHEFARGRSRGAWRSVLRVSAVSAAALVVIASCSSGGGKSPSSKATGATGRAGPTAYSSAGPDLGTLMPDAVPSGFALQPDRVGDTGPSDLAKAVRDDGGSDARAVLTHAGFRRGFQRLWVKQGADDENILFLYQFGDAAGASEYDQRSRGRLTEQTKGPQLTPFDVAGIPGATGVRGADQTGSAAIVLFAKDVYVVQAVANGAPGLDESAAATALAQAQYARL
jgi:hypothetical protein